MNTPVNYNDFTSLQSLKVEAGNDPRKAAREAAKHFEGLFVSMMLKSMRDTIPQDSLFGSNSMDSYQNMFDQQIALELSAKGGIGLADIIERQLLKSSEMAVAGNSENQGRDK